MEHMRNLSTELLRYYFIKKIIKGFVYVLSSRHISKTAGEKSEHHLFRA